MPSRPEFTFYAQSDVLTAKFSEFHNNYVVGGTYSGQILLWDTRAGYTRAYLILIGYSHNPVLKSPLGGLGHTHPVFSLQIVGSANANRLSLLILVELLSASTDGIVCSWQLDRLAQPLVISCALNLGMYRRFSN